MGDSHDISFLMGNGRLRRFQELDLSAQALVLGDTTRSHPWVEAIMLSLSKVADYHMVLTRHHSFSAC